LLARPRPGCTKNGHADPKNPAHLHGHKSAHEPGALAAFAARCPGGHFNSLLGHFRDDSPAHKVHFFLLAIPPIGMVSRCKLGTWLILRTSLKTIATRSSPNFPNS